MLDIFEVNFGHMSKKQLNEMFFLRKETFKDRLDWAVNCIDNMEFDTYDNDHANYILGVTNDTIICSVRIIEMQYPNMITGTFSSYFGEMNIPSGNYVESSRFFVDKARARHLISKKNPVGLMLFLAMIRYARHFNIEGILTIVSHSMLTILKRSGWKISVISQGLSEKKEKIYLLNLPVDDESQNALITRIAKITGDGSDRLVNWPLSVKLIKEQV